jgi:hypothetical protein
MIKRLQRLDELAAFDQADQSLHALSCRHGWPLTLRRIGKPYDRESAQSRSKRPASRVNAAILR